jgi:hypothetical protein
MQNAGSLDQILQHARTKYIDHKHCPSLLFFIKPSESFEQLHELTAVLASMIEIRDKAEEEKSELTKRLFLLNWRACYLMLILLQSCGA